MPYTNIQSKRLQLILGLTLSPEAAQHVVARTKQLNINPQVCENFQEIGEGFTKLDNQRLKGAQSGESPIIPAVSSFDTASRFIAQTNWPLKDKFEVLEAHIVFNEDSSPSIGYSVGEKPLEEWLKEHGHGDKVGFITDTLNDNLLAALKDKDVVFEDRHLTRRNQVLSAGDFKGYESYLNEHAFASVAKRARIVTHEINPKQTSVLVQEAANLDPNQGLVTKL